MFRDFWVEFLDSLLGIQMESLQIQVSEVCLKLIRTECLPAVRTAGPQIFISADVPSSTYAGSLCHDLVSAFLWVVLQTLLLCPASPTSLLAVKVLPYMSVYNMNFPLLLTISLLAHRVK